MNITERNTTDISSAPLQTLAQGSMFWRPDTLEVSPWLHHLPWIFWLVEALKPMRCVTLGSSTGAPHAALCQGSVRLGLAAECLLVDDDGKGEPVHDQAQRLYGNVSRRVESKLHRAAKLVEKQSVDILVLDLDVKRDDDIEDLIDRWLPRLSEQGVVLIPAVAMLEKGNECRRAFNVLSESYPGFSFAQGDGLGVLLVGSQPNRLLQSWLERWQNPNTASLVQDVFARLGRACMDEALIKQQGVHLAAMQEKVSQSLLLVDEADARNRELETSIVEQERSLTEAQLRTEYAEKAAQESQTREQTLQEKLNESSIQLRMRELETERINERHARLTEDNERLKIEARSLKSDVQAFNDSIESSNLMLEELEQQKGYQAAKEQERTTLQEALDEAQRLLEGQESVLQASEQQITELTETVNRQKKELEEYLESLTQASELAEISFKEKDQLSTQLNTLKSTLEHQLENERRQWNAEKSALEQQLKSAEQESSTHTKELSRLQGINTANEQALASLQTLVVSTEERASTSMSSSYKELATLRQQNTIYEQERSEHQALAESLNNVISGHEADKKSLRQRITGMEKDISSREKELREEHKKYKNELDTLNRQLKDLKNDPAKRTLEQRVQVLESEREEYEQTLRDVNIQHRSEVVELNKKIVELTKDPTKAALEQRVAELEQAITERDDIINTQFSQLEQMTSSISESAGKDGSISATEESSVAESDTTVSSAKEAAQLVPQSNYSHQRSKITKASGGWFFGGGSEKDKRKERRQQRLAREKALAEIEQSALFDREWYLQQYPDVAASADFAKNPALHYLKFGGFESRDPSPGFDSDAYLKANPDVAASEVNPLLHYLRFGQKEGRSPRPY